MNPKLEAMMSQLAIDLGKEAEMLAEMVKDHNYDNVAGLVEGIQDLVKQAREIDREACAQV